ncbi:hypothetical protein BESB_031340 [Besnoitia besnoiti]|uniref:Uncharacterized protein n=1 Tax=Besnoitia besnoiti TaxID=94643 RepID=A0A2A9M776_BESBE|nr:hypothetical protein BESB_031340 [Besnoitia besnoiti]PFH31260.1 hypothetical protein BESB_031340 [Besnoitia besnoiti]
MSLPCGPCADQDGRSSAAVPYWSEFAQGPMQPQQANAFGCMANSRQTSQSSAPNGDVAAPRGGVFSPQRPTDNMTLFWSSPSSSEAMLYAHPASDAAKSAAAGGMQAPGVPSFGVQDQRLSSRQPPPPARLTSGNLPGDSFANPTLPAGMQPMDQLPSGAGLSRLPPFMGQGVAASSGPVGTSQQYVGSFMSSASPAEDSHSTEANSVLELSADALASAEKSTERSLSNSAQSRTPSTELAAEAAVKPSGGKGASSTSGPATGRRSRKQTCFDHLYNDALVRRARKQKEEEALQSKPRTGPSRTPQQWEQRWAAMVKKHQDKLITNENLKRKLEISKIEDESRECTFKPVTWSSRKPLAQQKACLLKMKQLTEKQRELKNAVYVLQQEEREIDEHIAKELQDDIAVVSESGSEEEVQKILQFYRQLRAEETSRLRSLKLDLVSQVSRLEQQFKKTAATANLDEADTAATVGFDMKLAGLVREEVRDDIDAANSLRLGARFRTLLEAATGQRPVHPSEDALYAPVEPCDSYRRSSSAGVGRRTTSRPRCTQRIRSPLASARTGTPRFTYTPSQSDARDILSRPLTSRAAGPREAVPPALNTRRSTLAGGHILSTGRGGPQENARALAMSPRATGFYGNALPFPHAAPSAGYQHPDMVRAAAPQNLPGVAAANGNLGGNAAALATPCTAMEPNSQARVPPFAAYAGPQIRQPNAFQAACHFNSSSGFAGSPEALQAPMTAWQREKAKQQELRAQLPSPQSSAAAPGGVDRHRRVSVARGSSLATKRSSITPTWSAAGMQMDYHAFDREVSQGAASSRGATPRFSSQEKNASMRASFSPAARGYTPQVPPAAQQCQVAQTGTPRLPPTNRPHPGMLAPAGSTQPWSGQQGGPQALHMGAQGRPQPMPMPYAASPLQNAAGAHPVNAPAAPYHMGSTSLPAGLPSYPSNPNQAQAMMNVNARGQQQQPPQARPLAGAPVQPVMCGAPAFAPHMMLPNAASRPDYPMWSSLQSSAAGAAAPGSYAQPNPAVVAGLNSRSAAEGPNTTLPAGTESQYPVYPSVSRAVSLAPQNGAQFAPDFASYPQAPTNAPQATPRPKYSVQGEVDAVNSAPAAPRAAGGAVLAAPPQPAMVKNNQRAPSGAPAPTLPRLAGGAMLKVGLSGHDGFADFAATAKQLQRTTMVGLRA